MKMPDDDRVDGDDLDTQAGVCVFAELELVIFVGFNHRKVALIVLSGMWKRICARKAVVTA